MYDIEIEKDKINNLEQKAVKLVDTRLALAAQGYIVNNAKRDRLTFLTILSHIYNNIDVLSEEQKKKAQNLYEILV